VYFPTLGTYCLPLQGFRESWPPQGSGTSHPRRPAIPDKTVAETSNFAGVILNHPSRLSLALSEGQLPYYYLPAEVLNIIFKFRNNVGGLIAVPR